MTVNDYICRRCGAVRHATADELEFGRVLCGMCGGTCDPSPAALRHLWRARNEDVTNRPHEATTREDETMAIILSNYRHVGEIGEVVLQQMTDGQWYVERRYDCDGNRWERIYTGDEATARERYDATRSSVD